jgi:hypothetical protein
VCAPCPSTYNGSTAGTKVGSTAKGAAIYKMAAASTSDVKPTAYDLACVTKCKSKADTMKFSSKDAQLEYV